MALTAVRALGYVGIQTPRADEWRTFGPDVLGMQLADAGSDGTVRLRLDDKAYRLAVHPASSDALAYMGWDAGSREGLETAFSRLQQAGCKPREGSDEEARERQVQALVHVQDPAGNALELFHGPAGAPPFVPGRPISGFKTGELGMGHVVLGVGQQIDACREFYLDVLGFRLSDSFESSFMRMTFMHVNARHHSLALGTQKVGLHHIMLETNSIDDVGSTFDLCNAKGIPMSRTLGRHSNDLMFSFYIETPSGFDIEYGWNGRLVDDDTWEPQVLSSTSLWGHQFTPARAKLMEEMRRRATSNPEGSRSPAG